MSTDFLNPFPHGLLTTQQLWHNTEFTLNQYLNHYYNARETEYEIDIDGEFATGTIVHLASAAPDSPPAAKELVQLFSQTLASGVSGALSFGFNFNEAEVYWDAVLDRYFPYLGMNFTVPGGFVTFDSTTPYEFPATVTCTYNGINVPLFSTAVGPTGTVTLNTTLNWY